MIPLRAAQSVKRFPWSTVALLLVWVVADLTSRSWPGSRVDFLRGVAFYPESPSWKAIGALLFHTNVFSLLITLLFTWVFVPIVWERRGGLFLGLTALSGALLSFSTYAALHPHSVAPVLAPEVCLGAWLGVFMRRDIWGNIDTFVIGPGWARLLEVPSYVLLFFWLFYLLIGNLLTSPPFSDAPSLYWIPFISFLWGFVLESVWEILTKWISSSSNKRKSDVRKS